MNIIINILIIMVLFLLFQESLEKKGISLYYLEIPTYEFHEFSTLFKSLPSCSDELVKKLVKDRIKEHSKKKLELMKTLDNIFISNESKSLAKIENMINNESINSILNGTFKIIILSECILEKTIIRVNELLKQYNNQKSRNENQFIHYRLSQQALDRLIFLYPKYQPLIPQEQLKFANYFTNLFKDIDEPNLSARREAENSILVQKSSELYVGTRIKKWVCVYTTKINDSIDCQTLNVVSSKLLGVNQNSSLYPMILSIDDNAHYESGSGLVGDHDGVYFEGDILSVSGDITNVTVSSEMVISVENVELEGLEQNR